MYKNISYKLDKIKKSRVNQIKSHSDWILLNLPCSLKMIDNTQNGFLLLSPLWLCRIGKKKSHTFAEQWDKNLLQWSFKKHDTNWFLISERFSSYDFKNEPYRWASIFEINERNQPRRDSNVHFLLYLTVTIILRP